MVPTTAHTLLRSPPHKFQLSTFWQDRQDRPDTLAGDVLVVMMVSVGAKVNQLVQSKCTFLSSRAIFQRFFVSRFGGVFMSVVAGTWESTCGHCGKPLSIAAVLPPVRCPECGELFGEMDWTVLTEMRLVGSRRRASFVIEVGDGCDEA